MKISDLDQPRIGDIVEFETDPDTVVEGVIVGETEDGYIYEFGDTGYTELVETCTYGKYYCSTDKKYKCRQGPKQSRSVSEGEFRQDDVEEYVPSNSQLDDIKSQYLPDWEMLDHRNLQAKYVAKDHRHALEFVEFINELSENMDHFAEVTQDVAEVTVKTSTFDVKGLTMLDFQLAMMVDDYAEKNDIEQVRMQGNFGMHEEKQRLDPKCWKGYKKQGTKMKGGIRVNNCVPESAGYIAKNTKEAQDPRFSSSMTADVGTDTMRKQLADFFPTKAPADGQQQIREAEYQGREVPLGRPMRGDVKKFKVYVRDPKSGNVKKINFGHGGTSAKRLGQKTMRIKKSNPARRRNFRARHRCNTAKNRMTARYWSCRAW